MTWTFCYIGDPDDPNFQWDDPEDDKYRIGNTPRRLVPRQIGVRLDFLIEHIWKMVRSGEFDGRQIDWGAWGLKMMGAQIQGLLKADCGFAEEIAALDASKHYVLVGAEGIMDGTHL